MRFTATAAILLSLAVAAQAQTADSPAMGSSAEPDQIVAEDFEQQTQVLVLGDAVGGGLGAGLMRMGEIDGRYEVSIRFNEESGLARPDVYDWAATLPKILEANSFDVIVVLIGSNDRQMIRSGNARFAFNTPEWIAAYTKQMDMLLDQLARSKARIYWVGIPPMAEAGYDADMQAISSLQRQRVEARGFTYLDFRKEFTTPGGQYTDMGPDDTGEVRKLRGKDGISFFKAGNNRMGQLVLAAIQSGDAPERKTDLPKSAAGETSTKPAAPAVPLFGQMALFGDNLTIVPKDVIMNATVVAGTAASPAAALEALRAISPPGSGAEKLFRLGDVAAVPRGRADDFSAPPTAE